VQLKIQSRTEKLHLVREFISEAARKYGFDEEAVGKIALAVDEACTNVIKHAYNYAPDRELQVNIQKSGTNLEVVITHDGKSFDPEAIKPPNMPDYLKHFRHGGLGMHLMRSLMDKVEYRAASNKKNEVHLLIQLPAGTSRS